MKTPEECAGLEDVRAAIDALDREILRLIGRRAGYVERAARFKSDSSSIRAAGRRKSMLDARRRWAAEENLDPDVIENLYTDLIRYFVERETESFKSRPNNG